MTMLTFLSIGALALSLSGPVDIYRCVGSDGVIQFSDEPCGGADSQVLKGIDESPLDGDVRLWKWLEEMKGESQTKSAATKRSSSTTPSVRTESGRVLKTRKLSPAPQVLTADDLPDRPSSQLAARVCSVQFYECAQADGVLMDSCVSEINQCTSGNAGACCPQEYVLRYQSLRAVGNTTRTAVRGALLGLPNE